MTTKDGNLNDGRAVYYQGKRIEDFTAEPVFARTLKYIQRYYELQNEKQGICMMKRVFSVLRCFFHLKVLRIWPKT